MRKLISSKPVEKQCFLLLLLKISVLKILMTTLLHRTTDLPSQHKMGKTWRIISFNFSPPSLVIGKWIESSGRSLPVTCLVLGGEHAKEQIHSKRLTKRSFNKSQRKTQAAEGKKSLAEECGKCILRCLSPARI